MQKNDFIMRLRPFPVSAKGACLPAFTPFSWGKCLIHMLLLLLQGQSCVSQTLFKEPPPLRGRATTSHAQHYEDKGFIQLLKVNVLMPPLCHLHPLPCCKKRQ